MNSRFLLPGQAWLRGLATVLVALYPTASLAHDAFGELGPFYASFLHPLADPLQATLLLGISAFLAGRALSFAQIAFPLLVASSSVAALALDAGQAAGLPPLLGPIVAFFVGLAAMVPEAIKPRLVAFTLVAVTGALAGLAPDVQGEDIILLRFFGTVFGITVLAVIAWFALDAFARHVTLIAPRVAGSWVAAIGILVTTFTA